MLKKEEILDSWADVDPRIVDTGVKQAEDRLRDAIDNKKSIELKALGMLVASMLSTSVLFFGAYFFAVPLWSVMIACSMSIIGGIFGVLALAPGKYGTVGRCPDTWLQRDKLLSSDESAYRITMAFVLHDYQERIDQSDKSNEKKNNVLSIALACGIAGLLALLVGMLVGV